MWGLHPALKDTMLPLWQKGQLAFVPFAGTEDLTRSHFETQDSVESGMPVAQPGGAPHSYGSGFLNRLAAALDGAARARVLHGRPAHGDDAATSSCRTCR